ncbi:MAG TPA: hypothetical protein VGL11_11000 [Candidatus Binatia bacterium]|jgi:cell division protein FtsB
MKRKYTISLALLIVLVTLFALYISRGTSQTTVQPLSAEQQAEVARLKREIAILEERVNTLEERLAKAGKYNVPSAGAL